jgi:hypothetical protein
MFFIRSAIGTLAIFLSFALHADAQNQGSTNVIYDVSRDFSIATNPNGVWSYGWKSNLTGAFTLCSYAGTSSFANGATAEYWGLANGQEPSIEKNSSTITGLQDGTEFPPGTVWFFAGFDGWPQNFGVIRFTVPNQGSSVYSLESAVRCYLEGAASRDADYHVVVNGVEVFGGFLPANSATGYTNTLTLATGDTVDFMVGRGADGLLWNSGLKIQATLSHPGLCIPHAATATATLVNGFLVGIDVIDGGCGYTNAPYVRISGGGGSGAMATATVSNGIVTRITVTDAGFGYTTPPRVQVASPPFMPWLDIAVSKVKVTQHVLLGKHYVLESSPDLNSWSQIGAQFTADEEVFDQEFDVDQTGRFFRIREVP